MLRLAALSCFICSAFGVVSILSKCRLEMVEYCHDRYDPFACLTSAASQMKEKSSCRVWVEASVSCLAAAEKSSLCDREHETKLKCLAKLHEEELPALCAGSEYYAQTRRDFG